MRDRRLVRLALTLTILLAAAVAPSMTGQAQTPVSSSSDDGTVVALGTAGIVDDWEIMVSEVIPDADPLVRMTLPGIYTPPSSGHAYTAIQLLATNGASIARELPFGLSFGVVGQSRLGYSSVFNSCPDTFATDGAYEAVAPDETREFTICWEVAAADIGTLVMFVDSIDDLHRFHFFALDDAPVLPFDDRNGTGASASPVIQDREATIPDLAFTVLGVDRDAADRIVGAVEWSMPPEPGHRFVLARISAQNVSDKVALPAALNYSLITPDSTRIDPSTGYCGNIPDPSFETPMVFPSGVVTFNLCWSVPVDTSDDLMLEVSFLDMEPLLIDLPSD